MEHVERSTDEAWTKWALSQMPKKAVHPELNTPENMVRNWCVIHSNWVPSNFQVDELLTSLEHNRSDS